MTAQKLYGILKFLDSLDSALGLQASLEQIKTALDNLVNSPAQPNFQNNLANALSSLESAVSQLRTSISPSQFAAIKAMGGEEFFDPSIYDRIKNTVQTNAMTPTVAREYVKDFTSRRASFLSVVRSALEGLEGLHIQESGLQTGSADVAFLIPRDIFENQLGPFAKELRFINSLIEDFSEAITGERQPAVLEQLSSSVPTVALAVAAPVALFVGTVVNRFLDAWLKVEKIRKLRAEVADMGLKGTALDEFTERITTTVEEVVEESTELVITKYSGDGGRKSELKNAIRQDLRRLFGQIERGLSVEFNVKKDPEDDSNKQKLLESIEAIANGMKFPGVAKEPMLLGTGEVLEGEIHMARQSTKTTHKTTTTKKASKEAGSVEAKA